MLRKIQFGFLAVFLLASGLTLHYVTPRAEVINLTSTDVMRFDNEIDNAAFDAKNDIARSRDVRLVYGRTLDGASVRTYANEDLWYYGKFDAGTIQSEVASVLLDQSKGDKLVPVVAWSYGWRVEFISLYPGIIKIARVDAAHTPLQWPSFLAIALYAALLWGGWRVWRRLAGAAARAAERARRAAEDVAHAAGGMAARAAEAAGSMGGAAAPETPRRPPPDISSER